MKKFAGLTKRNLMVFFKDWQSVVFSVLTSMIVFVLYLLFLKGTFMEAFQSVLDAVPGLADFIREEEIETYCDLLLFTGVLGSAMITVPFQCLSIIVRDRENKIDYDILATPVCRWQIVLSYFTAAALSAVLLTGLILTAGLAILVSKGSIYMDAAHVMGAYGVVVLGSVSATSLFMIVMLSFKSSSACGAFFGILSAAAGYVIGAYIPLSQFSESVQTVCNIFPASHITILLRNVLLNGVLSEMNRSAGGVDNGMFVYSLKEVFPFEAHMFGNNLDVSGMLVYVSLAVLVCTAVMIFTYAKTYKRK